MDHTREILTAYEAADVLGYEVQHVRRLLREGKIEGQKIGRDWLIYRTAIMRYVANRNGTTPPLRT